MVHVHNLLYCSKCMLRVRFLSHFRLLSVMFEIMLAFRLLIRFSGHAGIHFFYPQVHFVHYWHVT